MPQIFQVLRCYKCQTFQVHQVKKSNKWVCKICTEKQSLKRHYGIGTGLECRVHVQKLNGIRGGIYNDDPDNESLNDSVEYDTSDESNNGKQSQWDNSVINAKECTTKCKDDTMYLENSKVPSNKCCYYNSKKQSKWNNYLDEEEECVTKDKNETMHLDNIEVVLEVPKKKLKKKQNTYDSNENFPDISNSVNNGVSLTNSKNYVRKYENNSKLTNLKLLLQDNTPNNAFNDDPIVSYTWDQPNNCGNGKQSKWNNYVKNSKDSLNKSYYCNSKKQSKWNNYIDEEEECDAEYIDKTMNLETTEVVLEVSNKRSIKKHNTYNEYLDIGNSDALTNNKSCVIKYENNSKLTNLNLNDTANSVKIYDMELDKNKKSQNESKRNMYIIKETDANTRKSPISEQKTAVVSTSKDMKVMFSLCEDSDIDNILSI